MAKKLLVMANPLLSIFATLKCKAGRVIRMTNFIPIFPLGIVVYPGEKLHLHIFEPRYKQLVTECFSDKKPFGIPAVIENRLQDFGTVVTITEITTVHDNGEMDIKT